MIFAAPIPFEAARASLAAKKLLPTELGSAELDAIAAAIKRDSVFSAKTTLLDFLSRVFGTVSQIVDPTLTGQQPGSYMDKGRAKELLLAEIKRSGWTAEGAGVAPGSIQDLSSDGRLTLIVETNTDLERGKAQFMQANLPGAVDAFPALELFRLEDREVKRDWPSRWRGAGGRFFGGGRMVALKDDPVWENLSRFGNPWPPFDYNSGMWTRSISLREAVQLGVLDADAAGAPKANPVADTIAKIFGGAQASLAGTPSALTDALPAAFAFVDGVLKFANIGNSMGAARGPSPAPASRPTTLRPLCPPRPPNVETKGTEP